MTTIHIEPVAPTMTLQDLGRPGHVAQGLAPGGAMDRLAVIEAAALLGNLWAAIEMAGVGGRFIADAPCRFALTGAPMRARVGGAQIAWNASHSLAPGETLEIGGTLAGVHGYLTFGGGPAGEGWLGSHATHSAIGIGAPFEAGDELRLGPDPATDAVGLKIEPIPRLGGGRLRLMPGAQTEMFDAGTRARFFATRFTRAAQANRQGVKLLAGTPFASETATIASDFIQAGDVQMTGEGIPYILMAECQTIGGYPRIGTVLPADLPRVAQAAEGDVLTFEEVDVATADATWRSTAELLREAEGRVSRQVRDPREMADLASYRLIDGVTRGDDI